MSGISRAVRDAIAASRAPGGKTIREWQEGAEVRAFNQAFANCPLDTAEPAAEAAEALLADGDWAERLLTPLIAALAADPYFEPPFKTARDALRIGGALLDCAAVSIAASVTSSVAMALRPTPDAIVFPGRVTVTRILKSGGATLKRWRAEPLTPEFSALTAAPCRPSAPLRLSPGLVFRTDGRIEAQSMTGLKSDAVMLVATIKAGAAPLMREYSLETLRLTRVANADDRPSRAEMLLTFLRLSGRTDAGEGFDRMTRDPAFHLRWIAMREWLALDARTALPRLAEMARGDPNSEVRAAATLTLVTVKRRLAEAQCRV